MTFKKGQSGNPNGRPKGSGLAATLRKAIENDAADIVQALVKQAKAGDVQAARVLLDRVCPTLRAEAQAADVPDMARGGLAERATAVLDAAANGQLPPDTASQLMQAVGTLARVVEVEELERRLTRIEKAQETNK